MPSGKTGQSAVYESLKNFITEYVSNNKASSWHLIWIDEKPFLMCCHYAKETYFGGLIELSNQKKILLKGLTYESARVSFEEDPKGRSSGKEAAEVLPDKNIVCVSKQIPVCPKFLWYVSFGSGCYPGLGFPPEIQLFHCTWISDSDSCFITCAWYPAFESTSKFCLRQSQEIGKGNNVLPGSKPSRCPRVTGRSRNL